MAAILTSQHGKPMKNDHMYIMVYDICNQKRWRKVYKTAKSFGEWVQLSVFQCILSEKQLLRLEHELYDHIKHGEDHVLIFDLGSVDRVELRFKSLGKPFEIIERRARII